ncbi:MAG TPA: PIN domain-containing protein [Gammaproteobacteria bacterium]|nr:PIN domain-containing protein [Gammaproteobacteria bacterium]
MDAGALIAIERGNRAVQALLERIKKGGTKILVPAAVVAEVWRDGARQARIAKLLAAPETEVVALNDRRARIAGIMLGLAGIGGVVDASVVVCAREHGSDVPVLTSDPGDLSALDGTLAVVAI